MSGRVRLPLSGRREARRVCPVSAYVGHRPCSLTRNAFSQPNWNCLTPPNLRLNPHVLRSADVSVKGRRGGYWLPGRCTSSVERTFGHRPTLSGFARRGRGPGPRTHANIRGASGGFPSASCLWNGREGESLRACALREGRLVTSPGGWGGSLQACALREGRPPTPSSRAA